MREGTGDERGDASGREGTVLEAIRESRLLLLSGKAERETQSSLSRIVVVLISQFAPFGACDSLRPRNFLLLAY